MEEVDVEGGSPDVGQSIAESLERADSEPIRRAQLRALRCSMGMKPAYATLAFSRAREFRGVFLRRMAGMIMIVQCGFSAYFSLLLLTTLRIISVLLH